MSQPLDTSEDGFHFNGSLPSPRVVHHPSHVEARRMRDRACLAHPRSPSTRSTLAWMRRRLSPEYARKVTGHVQFAFNSGFNLKLKFACANTRPQSLGPWAKACHANTESASATRQSASATCPSAVHYTHTVDCACMGEDRQEGERMGARVSTLGWQLGSVGTAVAVSGNLK